VSPATAIAGSVFLFQSLLCWIMVCKTLTQRPPSKIPVSFNPCYVGLWSVRELSLRAVADHCLFQSLLCWIMVCKKHGPECLAVVKSFNPCYVGLWSVRRTKYNSRDSCQAFQSLLCWIMVCKTTPTTPFIFVKAVSILVMLDYGL